ncbi:MAG: hypothetical protein ACOYK8_02320 [Alphaproteobacteria bacterium]
MSSTSNDLFDGWGEPQQNDNDFDEFLSEFDQKTLVFNQVTLIHDYLSEVAQHKDCKIELGYIADNTTLFIFAKPSQLLEKTQSLLLDIDVQMIAGGFKLRPAPLLPDETSSTADGYEPSFIVEFRGEAALCVNPYDVPYTDDLVRAIKRIIDLVTEQPSQPTIRLPEIAIQQPNAQSNLRQSSEIILPPITAIKTTPPRP